MGFRKIKFLKSVDRRTYIKGSFIGKYRGEFDKTKSDSFSNNEEYYDIDVYEGELVNFKIERDNPSEINEKKHAEFQSEVHFLQKQFDNIISKPVTPLVDDFDVFKFKIVEPKIKNVKIEKVIKDDRQTFGTFTCTVFGYIVDTIEVEEEIDVEVCDQCDKLVSNCICQTRGGGEIIEEVKNCNNCKKPLIDCVCPPSPPDRPINTKTNWGCLDIVKWLFFIMLIIGCLSLLFAIGLPGVIYITAIALIIFLIYYFKPLRNLTFRLLEFIFNIFSYALFIGYIILLIYTFTNGFKGCSGCNRSYKSETTTTKTKKNSTTSSTTSYNEPKDDKKSSRNSYKPSDNNIKEDSLISHKIYWSDYNRNNYVGNLEVLKSDYLLSKSNRVNSDYYLVDDYAWSRLYRRLITHDRDRLDRVYNMFDKIQENRRLNKIEFAEMVVSCIQDIDYALVLGGDCNPLFYDDNDINSILNDCPSCCIGNVKYGIQSPIEFMANLKGDCDTRTVLLYTILSKFGYDVVVLGSIQYRHSVLGINLPYTGKYKLINGKKYYVWETTVSGVEPGIISPSQTNMSLWNVHINSNKN